LCEAFGCLPSQLDEEDPRLLSRIMQLRAYEGTREALDHAEKQSDVPVTPMTETWVKVQREKMNSR